MGEGLGVRAALPIYQLSTKYGDIIFTLGRALITEVRRRPLSSSGGEGRGEEASYLFQRIQFAVDSNPMAKIAHALYANGFLRAVSVGFIRLASLHFGNVLEIPKRAAPFP